jgi:glucose-1-phosphate thymidylyltransferase
MSHKIKGICLAGGFGKRMLPATEVTNKHLLPIYNTTMGAVPIIHFPLETLKNSGVTEILVISSQDHCGDIISHLGDGKKLGLDLTYKIQDMNPADGITGIAQALKLAEGFVGTSNFAVILGDNFFENTFAEEFTSFDQQQTNIKMEHSYSGYNLAPAAIFLKAVHDPQRYGVATTNNKGRVVKIVEKPEHPETNLAVSGLYLFTPQVFSLLPHLKPSRRMELEISDINNQYVKDGTMKSYMLKGFWNDMGTPESLVATQNFLEAKHAKV